MEKILSRKEIEWKAPDIRQIGGTRTYELSEGATRGTRVIDVTWRVALQCSGGSGYGHLSRPVTRVSI